MSRLKSWFITPYLLSLVAAVAAGAVLPWFGNPAWGALILGALPVAWITVVHTLHPSRVRTPRRYPSFGLLAVAGFLLSFLGWPDVLPVVLSGALVAGLLLYLYWYSEYGKVDRPFLRVGQPLPRFDAWEKGHSVSSASLRGSPALLLFYRGNWCPVCTAQVDELARSYDELTDRGIRVILISPQTEAHNEALAQRIGLPFTFWEDRGNVAAQRLGIVDPAGLPLGMEALGYGADTPVPTALLVGPDQTILYSDQAENYRLRPEPREYLEAWDQANPTSPNAAGMARSAHT